METFGEYDPATPLTQTYCRKISAKEYEEQGSMETFAALQDLLAFMDTNSDVFLKILAKKKQEEAENEGIFSYLKCKVLERLKGPNYMMGDISQDECNEGLEQMQSEMCEVFNYAQDTKSSPIAKRFSKRLAAKRVNRSSPQRARTPKKARVPTAPPPPPPCPPPGSATDPAPADSRSVLGIAPSPRKPLRHADAPAKRTQGPREESSSRTPAGPPTVAPPPPPPLPVAATTTPSSIAKKPLQERTNTITTPTGLPQSLAKKALLKSEQRVTQLRKVGSTTSLNSVHDELLGFDRGKLKAVKSSGRSPGRTPKRKIPPRPQQPGGGGGSRAVPGDLNVDSFNLKILEKFKNVHSPGRHGSPYSGCSSFNSSGGFTP